LNDLVGQSKIIQTLPELDKLLLVAPLQMFLGLLVATPLRIALCGRVRLLIELGLMFSA